LTDARPRIGTALCVTYAGVKLCTAPPPSMGGMVMLQTLLTVTPGDPSDPAFVHRFLEASRLAEADRRRYLADPAFVPVPVEGLLDHDYLAGRAGLITPGQTIARPRPGSLAEEARASDPGAPQAGTSQIVVADREGMVVSMTSTVNLHFGARRAALGMVLNNALINFAPPPPTTFASQNDHYANEMEPGKRPLTPATPVIALDEAGHPVLVGGGAGGTPIPDTVALSVMDILVNHRDLPATLAAGHAHAADPDHLVLEEGTAAASLQAPLEAAGHRVALEPVSTGNAFILRTAEGWVGAADPRRDGTVGSLP
jgi:gamma-glutamyltranspeptidase/glutathione hydrolase